MSQRAHTVRRLFVIMGGAFGVILFVLILAAPRASSQSASPITGWAWGGDYIDANSNGTQDAGEPTNGAGWISLNCSTDPGGCATVAGNWGLSNDGSGNITGYAWSENIGWIKFGGLSAFPAAGGNVAFSNGQFSGWARACAGTASGDCSSMTSRTDGWDGWISLSGSGPGYAVSVASNPTYSPSISGAWGDAVIGWLGFAPGATCAPTGLSCTSTTTYASWTDSSCVVYPATTCGANEVCVNGFGCTNTPPGGCLSVGFDVRTTTCLDAVTSGKVIRGQNVTLYWQVLNVNSCTLRRYPEPNNNQNLNLPASNVSGSYTSEAITQPTTFTLNCHKDGGAGQGDQVWTIVVNPYPKFIEQ